MLKKTKGILAALTLLAAVLAGCSGPKETEPPAGSERPHAEETLAPSAAPPSPAPSEAAEKVPLVVSSSEDIQQALEAAIRSVDQPPPMDLSGADLGENVDMAVKNLYYALTSRNPELKYAYDVSAETEDGLLLCRVSYMPYKTGNWPAGWEGTEISDLGELLRAAEERLGEEPLPVRVTDPSLVPDEMDRVLQQAGGGYILCALNRDGTEITFSPAMGMETEECLSRLELADRLAEQVVAQEVTDSMTEREKAEALYTYLTGSVKYDQRYYSDRENMPYEAQTAVGALRDGLAICGGYSHALRLLFEKAGIPCFNMTGKYFGENHMWSLARLDGEWLWFDATSDRGVSPQFGLRHFAMEELDETQYQWEESQAELLLRLAGEEV